MSVLCHSLLCTMMTNSFFRYMTYMILLSRPPMVFNYIIRSISAYFIVYYFCFWRVYILRVNLTNKIAFISEEGKDTTSECTHRQWECTVSWDKCSLFFACMSSSPMMQSTACLRNIMIRDWRSQTEKGWGILLFGDTRYWIWASYNKQKQGYLYIYLQYFMIVLDQF